MRGWYREHEAFLKENIIGKAVFVDGEQRDNTVCFAGFGKFFEPIGGILAQMQRDLGVFYAKGGEYGGEERR